MELGVVVSIVGVGVAITAQTVAIVWFFSRLNSRVEALELAQNDLKGTRHSERLIKIETLLEIVQVQQDEQIKRLDDLLKQSAQAGQQRSELLTRTPRRTRT